MWPFGKKENEKGTWHADFAASPELTESEEKEIKEEIKKNQKVEFCCGRFSEAVSEQEIVHAYSESTEIDETSWFIPGFWHLYFCPFCGKNIKGTGFGKYDQQTKEAF